VLNDAADLGIVEKHAGLAAIAIHAVDYQFFEVLVEGVGEIVACVGGSGLLQVLVGEDVVTDLLPEELAGGGEVGAEAIIEKLNHWREEDGSVLVAAGADFRWGGKSAADSGFQHNAAVAELLVSVVLEVDILIEVEGVVRIRTAQLFVQQA